jgi:hypothetical protein
MNDKIADINLGFSSSTRLIASRLIINRMDYLSGNSATLQRRKSEIIKRHMIQEKQKEIYQRKMAEIALKSWQQASPSPSPKKKDQEEVSKAAPKQYEKVYSLENARPKSAPVPAPLVPSLHPVPTLSSSSKSQTSKPQTPKPPTPITSSDLVAYSPNPGSLDMNHYQMVYIKYLLNTFELYPEFDIHYYRNNNPDVKNLNNYEVAYHWNHVGIHEKETRIYNRETFFAKNPNFYKEFPIYIFIHVCSLHNGIPIFYDQMANIMESGLYDKCKNILVSIVGKKFDLPIDKYPKMKLLYHDDNPKFYEVKTINYIQHISQYLPDNARVLYVHTKGVRKNGDEVCVRSWRKLLEYWTINKHDIALQYLQNYDTVGSNVINMSPAPAIKEQFLFYVNPAHYFHYSGNFWWTTAQHIRRLPQLAHDPANHSMSTRSRAENWILSPMPNMRAFEMYYNKNYVHPYYLFCDPKSYQRPYIEIFTGRNSFK